jgi:hypothetical protein
LWRLVYADPQFSRDDVIREWQEPQSAAESTEPAPTAVPDIDALKEHDAGRRMGRQPTRRGAYFGALEQFILRFKSETFARLSDGAVARQFELHCEELLRTGKPAPPLPSDRRNIKRQVAKIRDRLAATITNTTARATPKTR